MMIDSIAEFHDHVFVNIAKKTMKNASVGLSRDDGATTIPT